MATPEGKHPRAPVRRGPKPSEAKATHKRASPSTAKPARPASSATARRVAQTRGPDVGSREKHPGRPKQGRTFFADARHAKDGLAEELGEDFVLSATSGEDSEELYERERDDEEGGPFLETSGRVEFGYGVDESNPEEAEVAPWPSVSPGAPPPHRSGGPR